MRVSMDLAAAEERRRKNREYSRENRERQRERLEAMTTEIANLRCEVAGLKAENELLQRATGCFQPMVTLTEEAWWPRLLVVEDETLLLLL